MIDTQKLRSIPIEQVAQALDMPVWRGHKALCPFHNDHHPSLSFNRRGNFYYCYSCKAHGDGIDLTRFMLNLNFRDACVWLSQTFGLPMAECTERHFAVRTRKIEPVTEPPTCKVDTVYLGNLLANAYLSQLARHFLFDERRLDPTVISRMGISSIERDVAMSYDCHQGWFRAPALLIPYRDLKGKVINVQARCLRGGAVPRFQFPRGSHPMFFNLPQLMDLAPGDDLFITEGVTDCLAALSAGCKAIAIPSATLLKAEDIQLLKRYSGSVTLHMAPDNDAPGQDLFRQMHDAFPAIVRHALPHGCKDIAEYFVLHNLPTPKKVNHIPY